MGRPRLGRPGTGRSVSRVPCGGRGVLGTGLGPGRSGRTRGPGPASRQRGPGEGQRKPWAFLEEGSPGAEGGLAQATRTAGGRTWTWSCGGGMGSRHCPSARESGVRRKGQSGERDGTSVRPAVVGAGSFWKFPQQAETGSSFPEPQSLAVPPLSGHPGIRGSCPSTGRPAPTSPRVAPPSLLRPDSKQNSRNSLLPP